MKDENNPNIISLERSLGGSRSEFSTGFQAESVTPFDDVAIPRRPHIVPGLLTRKQLTILVGPPGASKSTFAAQAAIAIATGVEWGGFENAEQCKGLIIAKEEDGDEHNRRIAAFLQIMNKSQVEIENQLLDKGFNQRTLQKMLRLKYELLKLDEADFEQGKETRRESKTNRRNFNNTLRTDPEVIKQYFNTTEILNREALPLKQDYKQRVQRYFNKKND